MEVDDDHTSDFNAKLEDLSLPQLPPGVFSLGDIYSAPPVAATAGVLCASILRARSVLGGFGDVPPLATPVSAACVTAFCTAAGCAYADDAPATVFLEWLAIELQALRMALASKSRAARAAVSGTRAESLENELTSLARALSIPPPRADVAANQPDKVLAQIKGKLDPLVERLPREFFSAPALLGSADMSADARGTLASINDALRVDYGTRRAMLLQRLDVTVQSFLWSEKAVGRESEIESSLAQRRRALQSTAPAIVPDDAFAAGPEVAALLLRRITDASSAGTRAAAVKAVRIGDVPDRGGRVEEMKLKPGKEMPAWQARKEAAAAASGGGGGGRGGGGGGRGGRGGAKGGGGGGAPSKDERARTLLAEASKFEGEAGAALVEHEQDMAAEAADGGGGDAEGGGAGDDVVMGDDAGGGARASGGGGGRGGGRQTWRPRGGGSGKGAKRARGGGGGGGGGGGAADA